MSTPEKNAYVISHTHWDREWRYPIWQTTAMLVEFMDELLDLLENGTLKGFLLDGQVRPVLDYLEQRPENSGRVKALIADGKLEVGPWYTLPDEYPIDGEALVRNLLKGLRGSRELGKTFEVGYTPFGWGQTAQLPQIYRGFGIDLAMVGKRVGVERAPHSEFTWQAPDGTEMLATRFGELGRQNFFLRLHLSVLFGRHYETDQWRYRREDQASLFHRCDTEQMEQDVFRLDTSTAWNFDLLTPELIERVWNTTRDSLLEDDRLMMNGCDYAAGQKLMPELIDKINKLDAPNQRTWRQTTMREYIKTMREKLADRKLHMVKGELRDGPAGPTSGNALSTRLYLKALNKKAQSRLIRQAEPLAALSAALHGTEHPQKFIDTAWDYLLLSHPHDSINGVTQDKTADDVTHRLNQVIDISNTLTNTALQQIIGDLDLSGFRDDDEVVAVFNPYPYPRREVVEAWVLTDRYLPENEFWPWGDEGLQVMDANGNPHGTQWHGDTEECYPVAEIHNRALPYNCLRHHIYFDTGELPACGYKVFRVARSQDVAQNAVDIPRKSRLISSPSILKQANVLENEYIKVTVNPNGTFDLFDKASGKLYAGLNYFRDKGQTGDYWIDREPMHQRTVNSLGCRARIWAEDAGPLSATVVSTVTLDVPKRVIRAEKRRADNTVPLEITTRLTLERGAKGVKVNVTFDNCAEDHTLKAMFPTQLENASVVHSGGHFNVDRRPVVCQGPGSGLAWPDMKTQPQDRFADIADGHHGLAIINNSLAEYEVSDDSSRTLGLTLLRSVQNWICTESRAGSVFPAQKGGQCLGRHEIEYAIMPHQGDCFAAEIPLQAELFNTPVLPVQTRKKPGGTDEPERSYLSVSNPNIIFSALKKAENSDHLVLRLYNPTEESQPGNVRFGNGIDQVWETNLNEERQGAVQVDDGNINLIVPPKKIMTLEFASNDLTEK